MSEKWFYSIIHSCLRLYISLQKWHSTLEHLSLHLKPRGIRFLFLGGGGGGPAVERPEKENQVSCRFFFLIFFFRAINNPLASRRHRPLDERKFRDLPG